MTMNIMTVATVLFSSTTFLGGTVRNNQKRGEIVLRIISITNLTTGWIMAEKVQVAETMADRIKGLLGTSQLPIGCGLLLIPCRSIHTIGMVYAIDVLFLDAGYNVLKVVGDLKPMRTAACWAGEMTLELPAGMAARTGTQVGHRLQAGYSD